MAYQIRYVAWDDFDKLPYKGISDSLGIADPKRRIAYVRKTGSVLADGITAVHEIEHLVNPDDLHLDENGIYHKKVFKELFRNIGAASLLPITAPFGVNLGTQQFREQVGEAIPKEIGKIPILGAGLGAVQQGLPPGRGFRAGLPSTLAAGAVLGSAALGGFGGANAPVTGQAATGAANAAKGAGPLPGAVNPSGVLGSQAGPGGGIVQGIMDLTKKGISALTGFGKNIFGGGTTGATGTAGTAGTAAKAGMSTGSKLGLGIGAGLLGASAMRGTPEPPSYDELQTPSFKSASDLATKIATPGENPFSAEAKRLNEINYYGDPSSGRIGQREQIINRYAALGHYPGRSGELDALLERTDQEFLRGQNELDRQSQFQSERLAMQDFIQLANIDISVAALKYGISVEDARSLREMLGRAGGLAIGASILGG